MYLRNAVTPCNGSGSDLLFTATKTLISDGRYSLPFVGQEHLADNNLAVGLCCVQKILLKAISV